MHLVLCHTTADFDTLGAAVGLTRLHPGMRIVLSGGAHPTVREFLALHRDEYPLIERRAVAAEQIQSLWIVDTQWRDRLGKASEWLDLPGVPIHVIDHHSGMDQDAGGDAAEATGLIQAMDCQVDAVGAATTLVVELLQAEAVTLNAIDATVMALGIHVDTGSLTFDHTTVRDAAALTWLMQQGANVRAIADYVEPGLSPQLQDLLTEALDTLHTETLRGFQLGWVLLKAAEYVPGLSSLTSHLADLTECDVLLLGCRYGRNEQGESRVTVIGRSRGSALADAVNLGELMTPLGGGGHAKAAAVTVKSTNPGEVISRLVQQVRSHLPHPPTAQELMSSPVRTIRPEVTIAEAQRILLRYGHSGLSVVNEADELVGVISRRDLDIALHHGFSHAPVKGYMTTQIRTITPDTPLPDIEALMVTYDIGRLPVIEKGDLVGIVTRTDVLRQLHQQTVGGSPKQPQEPGYCPLPEVLWQEVGESLGDTQAEQAERSEETLWSVLMQAAHLAQARGWQLYMVGGAVRDLLHSMPALVESTMPWSADTMPDIDLVVDGVRQQDEEAAGVELARSLQAQYPQVRLQVHGRFQTAALVWHHDPALDSLWIDIATARTEFYPYPAANPEVEASSIRQDLYRRDFTINAMAIRLTPPRQGELLDFFGGLRDLQQGQIRVLHANSFIEDPTRIFRAVRFAVRLGFVLEPQTEGYIRHAIASGIYQRVQADQQRAPALQTRLKRELHYILDAPYWRTAIQHLADLGALRCIHPDLHLTADLWHQLRLVDRALQRFAPSPAPEHWQMLLEVLLAAVPPGDALGDDTTDRATLAEGLQLSADSIERLQQLAGVETQLAQALPQCQRPSEVVRLLQSYDLPLLILVSVRGDRPLRRQIWQYLTRWARVEPMLNGNDLKRLGYKPGRQFSTMLEALRQATLDGQVTTPAEAEAFLKAQFPS